jgi:hypothetical protein
MVLVASDARSVFDTPRFARLRVPRGFATQIALRFPQRAFGSRQRVKTVASG